MFFIGVCGSSASGKTTISKLIQQQYLEQHNIKSIIISLDMFYKETEDYPEQYRIYKNLCRSKENLEKPLEEREIFNFDIPEFNGNFYLIPKDKEGIKILNLGQLKCEPSLYRYQYKFDKNL